MSSKTDKPGILAGSVPGLLVAVLGALVSIGIAIYGTTVAQSSAEEQTARSQRIEAYFEYAQVAGTYFNRHPDFDPIGPEFYLSYYKAASYAMSTGESEDDESTSDFEYIEEIRKRVESSSKGSVRDAIFDFLAAQCSDLNPQLTEACSPRPTPSYYEESYGE